MIDVENHFAVHKPNWMFDRRRNCAKVDPAVFFDGTAKGVAVCQGCPVQTDCLKWALDHNERGTWGGTSERARGRMRRASKKAGEQ